MIASHFGLSAGLRLVTMGSVMILVSLGAEIWAAYDEADSGGGGWEVWLSRWGPMALIALVLGWFAVSGAQEWADGRRREATGAKLACTMNLHQVARAMVLYARADPDGALPPGLGGLTGAGGVPIPAPVCPASGGGFIYVGAGRTPEFGDETVIAFEPLSNHAGTFGLEGGHVMRADGDVRWQRASFLRERVAEALADGRLSAADAAEVLDVPAR